MFHWIEITMDGFETKYTGRLLCLETGAKIEKYTSAGGTYNLSYQANQDVEFGIYPTEAERDESWNKLKAELGVK